MTDRLDIPPELQYLIEKRNESERRQAPDRRQNELPQEVAAKIEPSDDAGAEPKERRSSNERRQTKRREADL